MIRSVIGFDPSLRNWGFSTGTLDLDTLDLKIEYIGSIQTGTDDGGGKSVRKSSNDLASARKLREGVVKVIDAVENPLIFVEVPVGSKSASAMKGYGVCLGVLASMPQFFEVDPNSLKKAIGGSLSVSKMEIILKMAARFPHLPWKVYRGEIAPGNEHAADSIAAIITGLQMKQFRDALALIRS